MGNKFFSLARSRLALVLVTAITTAMLVGGVAVAVNIPNNSITSNKIVDDAVQSRDIQDESLQSKDVEDGSLQGKDIKNGSIKPSDVNAALKPGAWALVEASSAGATVIDGRYATGSSRINTGIYSVTFSRDLTDCALSTGLGGPDGGTNPGPRTVWVNNAGMTLYLYTFDADGNATDLTGGMASSRISIHADC